MTKLTKFPEDLDTDEDLPDINANDAMDDEGIEHDVQHTLLNQAVIELQKKVGVNNSNVTVSHDWRISALESGSSLTPFLGDDELQQGDKDVPTKTELILKYVIDGKIYGIPAFYIKNEEKIFIKIVIDKNKVHGTIADYPCYVDLSLMPREFWELVKEGGGDIRCYSDTSKTIEFPREVVSCDKDEETGELHVLLDEIGDTDDYEFYISVDGFLDEYDVDDEFGAQAVWKDYYFVWHGNNLYDSTAYNREISNVGGAPIVTNGARKGRSTIASASTKKHLEIDSNISFVDGISDLPLTISSTQARADGGSIFVFSRGGDGNATNLEYNYFLDSSGNLNWRKYDSGAGNRQIRFTSTDNSISSNSISFTAVTTNGGNVSSSTDLFVNGELCSKAIGSEGIYNSITNYPNNKSRMGTFITTGSYQSINSEGVIFDVRVRLFRVSSDTLKTEYNNQSDPSSFFKTIELVED